MIDWLSRSLKSRCVTPVFDLSLFGEFSGFDSWTPSLRKLIHVEGPLDVSGDGDFIAGHLAFSTLKGGSPNADFMTVLREPRSRILSLWLYWRSYSDDALAQWGGWATYVKSARQPLAEFLSRSDISCQVDNISTRMLLWPHPLIPAAGFISKANDRTLLNAALRRLDQFAFVDTIDNPQFACNFGAWIGQSVEYPEVNRTSCIPAAFKTSLDQELRSDAFELLESCTRLDVQLWQKVVETRGIALDPDDFAQRIFARNVAWQSVLLGS